jgi:hypothetical protein
LVDKYAPDFLFDCDVLSIHYRSELVAIAMQTEQGTRLILTGRFSVCGLGELIINKVGGVILLDNCWDGEYQSEYLGLYYCGGLPPNHVYVKGLMVRKPEAYSGEEGWSKMHDCGYTLMQ